MRLEVGLKFNENHLYLQMIEAVAKDNVKLSEKQLDELINLMEKEEVLESERRIQEALNQEMKQKMQKSAEAAVDKLNEVCRGFIWRNSQILKYNYPPFLTLGHQ